MAGVALKRISLPDWLGLAAYRRLNDQWAVMSSVRWTNWSLFKKLQIDFADGSQSLTEEELGRNAGHSTSA